MHFLWTVWLEVKTSPPCARTCSGIWVFLIISNWTPLSFGDFLLGTFSHKRGCPVCAQEPTFRSSTTMKVWNLVFFDILSVGISVAYQTRPTLWIFVKNCGFLSYSPKNSVYFTFIWVIPLLKVKGFIVNFLKIQIHNFWPKSIKLDWFGLQHLYLQIEYQKTPNFKPSL